MKRTTLIILFALFHFALNGQVNKLYRKAIRTTNLEEKISLLSEVIELEPKNLDAYFYRGIAKNDSGDYLGAIVDYSKIIVEEPDADTYYNRGNSRYSLKDFEGAKNDYAKAYELDKNFVDAIYSLACVKFDIEDFEGAIKDFGSVIKIIPNQPKTYLMRASAFRALKYYKKALKDYSLAILIEPSSNNYYNRGEFLMNINYYKEANNDFSKSIRLNNNNSFAYFYRGSSNLFLGRFNNAITDFTIATKFDSEDFDAYLGLALAYYKLNNIKYAKLNLHKAEDILTLPDTKIKISELYMNTYWYQNQYYYFVNNINELYKL